MHHHCPKCLVGPLRGTTGWWQELGKLPPATQAAPPRKRRTRRGSSFKAQETSEIRRQLVQRVRGEIAAGTYDTPEKWEAALDELLDRL